MCSVIARAFGRADESIERCTVRVKQICSLGSIVDLLRASRPTLGVSAHGQKDENRKRRASRGDARDGVLRLDDASTRLPRLARTTRTTRFYTIFHERVGKYFFSFCTVTSYAENRTKSSDERSPTNFKKSLREISDGFARSHRRDATRVRCTACARYDEDVETVIRTKFRVRNRFVVVVIYHYTSNIRVLLPSTNDGVRSSQEEKLEHLEQTRFRTAIHRRRRLGTVVKRRRRRTNSSAAR
jgi:hypothetical protein